MLNPALDFEKTSKLSFQIRRGYVVNNEDPKKMGRVRVRLADLHTGVEDEDLPWCLPFIYLWQGMSKTVGFVSPPVKGSHIAVVFADETGMSLYYFGAFPSEQVVIKELTELDYPHCYGHVDRSGNLWLVNTRRDTIKMIHVSGTSFAVDGKGHMKITIADAAVGEEAQEEFDPGLTLIVKGAVAAKVLSNFQLDVGGDYIVKAAGKIEHHAGGTMSNKAAGALSLESQAAASLKGSSMNIGASGSVDVGGSQFNWTTGGGSAGGAPTAPAETPEVKARKRPAEEGFEGKTDI